MATPERPIPDRDPDYVVNPTVNSPNYINEPRRASRGMGGLAAAIIIVVIAFLAFAVFSGNRGTQEANAPANTPAVTGTENPSTGSITPDTATPAPADNNAPAAAPADNNAATTAPANNAPAAAPADNNAGTTTTPPPATNQ